MNIENMTPVAQRMKWSRGLVAPFGLAVLVIAGLTACGGGGTVNNAPKVGQVAAYTPTNANEEGYWYSRYNMMSLTMQSGLGESFMPTMDDMNMAMQAAAQNPADPAMAPVNPALLNVVYAGGDPHYVTATNPMDFGTLRWKGDPAKVTTVEATAWTITKEIEWAKLFHVDSHFGTPTSSFGATQRFAGMMFAPMVKMQFMALQQNPGRFGASKLGDFALLTAYSDAAGFFGAATMPHSTTNRYADAMAAQSDAAMASTQFQKVLLASPADVRELSSAIQSVVWFAAIATDPVELASAHSAIVKWADAISVNADSSPVDRAYALRGLIEAGRTIDAKYLDQATTVYKALVANFDNEHGVLAGSTTLTTDGVGEIAGALNAATLFLGNRIDQAALKLLFGAWWEGTVNLSGFQIAAPAIPDFKGAYETQQDPINLRYPTLALPKDVGAPYGTAPVFAASVKWASAGWQANQNWFDTAGAMHAANEFVWFHNDEVNGFPDVRLP